MPRPSSCRKALDFLLFAGHSLGEKLLSGGQESAAVTEYVWSLERRLRLVAEQSQDFACSVATKLKDRTCKQRKGSAGNTQGHSAGHSKAPENKTDKGDSYASDPDHSVQECERVDTNGKSTWETRKCHKNCQVSFERESMRRQHVSRASTHPHLMCAQGGCDNRRPIVKGEHIARSKRTIAKAKKAGKKSRIEFLYDGCQKDLLKCK